MVAAADNEDDRTLIAKFWQFLVYGCPVNLTVANMLSFCSFSVVMCIILSLTLKNVFTGFWFILFMLLLVMLIVVVVLKHVNSKANAHCRVLDYVDEKIESVRSKLSTTMTEDGGDENNNNNDNTDSDYSYCGGGDGNGNGNDHPDNANDKDNGDASCDTNYIKNVAKQLNKQHNSKTRKIAVGKKSKSVVQDIKQKYQQKYPQTLRRGKLGGNNSVKTDNAEEFDNKVLQSIPESPFTNSNEKLD